MSDQEQQIRNEYAWNSLHGHQAEYVAVMQATALGEIAAQLCRANDLAESKLKALGFLSE